jgi:hypothetical protein
LKVLLDECVPWPIHELLTSHQCFTVQQRGWAGLKNGALLRLAEAEFDLFITADQNIRYQQNLAGSRIRVLELSTNNLRRIRVASQLIRETLAEMEPGDVRTLRIP